MRARKRKRISFWTIITHKMESFPSGYGKKARKESERDDQSWYFSWCQPLRLGALLYGSNHSRKNIILETGWWEENLEQLFFIFSDNRTKLLKGIQNIRFERCNWPFFLQLSQLNLREIYWKDLFPQYTIAYAMVK